MWLFVQSHPILRCHQSQATLLFLAFARFPSSILTTRPLPCDTTFGSRFWRDRTAGAEVDRGMGLPVVVAAVVGRLLKPMVVFGRLCLLEPTGTGRTEECKTDVWRIMAKILQLLGFHTTTINNNDTVEPHYNEDLGTMRITFWYQGKKTKK